MAITNLTGTKWLLNEELTITDGAVYNLILKPNSYTFSVSDFVKIKSDYGFTASTWEELINNFIVLMENMGGTVTSTLSVINDKGNYVILSPGWWQEEPVNEIRMFTHGLENELGNFYFGINPTNILNLPEVSGTLSLYLYYEDETLELNDLTFLDVFDNFFLGGAAWYEIPYYENEWKFEQCRTIEITGGDDVTNPTLIAWLEENATQIIEPSGYTITFDSNGGTTISDIEEATELPTPLPTPTKSGYKFVAWYYESNFQTRAKAGDTIEANTTLYAKWHNLGSLFTEIADAIRSKDGTSGNIRDVDFGERVKQIQGAIELTQAQYDALPVYDNNTYYLIVEE